MGSGNLSSGSDLLDSSEFLSALRHLRQGVSLHAGSRLRRLHPRLLRHRRVFHYHDGRLWHRLVLSALCRQLLVWSTLHLRSRRGLYVEFGHGLEHHDRCWLHLWLSVLLSVVGTVGLLRSLLLGSGLGIRLRRLCQRERIRTLGQYCLREYPCRLGESLHGELWWGKPNRFPEHATRHRGRSRSRRQYQCLHRQHRRVGVGPLATIRRPASSLAAAPDTRAISTAAKERLAAAALPTTRTPAPGSPRAPTTFTREKTATSTAMTGRVEIGLRTAATDGNPRPDLRRICSSNNRHVL